MLLLMLLCIASCENKFTESQAEQKEVILKTEDITCASDSTALALKSFSDSEELTAGLQKDHPDLMNRVHDLSFDAGVDGSRYYYSVKIISNLNDVEIDLLRSVIKEELSLRANE